MSPSKTKRCECGHGDGFHAQKRGLMPAFCRSCKAPKAKHVFKEAAEVPA